jgi:hypothetical protein
MKQVLLLKQLIRRKIKFIYLFILKRRSFLFLKNRQKYKNSPYEFEIYENLISKLNNSKNVKIYDFSGKILKDKNLSHIIIRHDIDTINCIENVDMFIDFHIKNKIHSAFFFRVDEEEYKLKEFKEKVIRCVENDLKVGLHTSFYTYDDPLERFRIETKKFFTETGINPIYFTIHGLGEYKINERDKYKKIICDSLSTYGYSFTDCHYSLRLYDYVIEDCHLEGGNRFIYDDFFYNPEQLRNQVGLILTHPCYWQKK